MDTKVCFKCHLELPVAQFYRHPQMGDGYLGKCKECAKKDVRENYAKMRKDKVLYERRRSQNPTRKAKQREYARRMRERSPHKYRARQAVALAVKSGRLVWKPCEVCGSVEMVEGHHPDYSKPLDVVWLCFKHHLEAHGKQMADT